jgi:hypothetical protein
MSGIEVIGAINTVCELIKTCYTVYETVNGRSRVQAALKQELEILPRYGVLLDGARKVQEAHNRKYEDTSSDAQKTAIESRNGEMLKATNAIVSGLDKAKALLTHILPRTGDKRSSRYLKTLKLMLPLNHQEEVAQILKQLEGNFKFIEQLQSQDHHLYTLGPEPAVDPGYSRWPPRTAKQHKIAASYTDNSRGDSYVNCDNRTYNITSNKVDSRFNNNNYGIQIRLDSDGTNLPTMR